MLKTTNLNSGVYLLELYASKQFTINAKRFCSDRFARGYYYYSGSAQKNLRQRIDRHLRKEKIVHWHIDHLTTHPDVKIKNFFVAEGSLKNLECEFISTLQDEFHLNYAIIGFGNGDCNECSSHLLYSERKLDHNHFLSRYQSIVRLIPSSSPTF